ncbi:hypothetical protein [Acinetobacter sp. YH01009]|uniref:hypothetical protein n=1 Tax=Acinetobacter sp. YH01009 TaxID=2601025 RepID=UPI0015D2E788|nr:hypothetical protein [Acinetobacter sp. YH01009]
MKQMFILLTLALSSQSFAQLVQLNTNQFVKEFNLLQQQKDYNGQIKSNGYIHEKFLVTGKSIIDKRESVKMTGYYKADNGRDKMYSSSKYRVYCDDQSYVFALMDFEADGQMTVLTSESDYAFDYEDPTPRDREFSKVLKNACKHASLK